MKRTLLSGGIAAVAICLLPASGRAQTTEEASQATPATPTQADPQDIIVTAQKRSERLSDVGMAITAATGDTLVNRGITEPSQLARIEPSFVFARSNYGTPVYSLRGVGFYDTALGATPAVTVYQDQVPLSYSILTKGVGFDLDRVEILKGPQGTLFGQNSTGGAINFVAAKPTKAFSTGFDVSFGRFASLDATGFVSGPLSDAVRVRLALHTEQSADWQRSYTRRDSLGSRDLAYGRFLLDADITPDFSASVNITGGIDRSDSQAGQLIAVPNRTLKAGIVNYPLAPDNARAADWDAGTAFRRHDDQVQGSLALQYALAPHLELRSITSYQYFDAASTADVDGTSFQVFTSDNTGGIKSFYQEILLQNPGQNGLVWTIGGNLSHDVVNDRLGSFFRDGRFGAIGLLSSAPATTQRVTTKAAFADVEYEILPAVTVQGGVRYTSQNRRFVGCGYDSGDGTNAAVINRILGQPGLVLPGGCATLNASGRPEIVRSELNEDNVSWRGGVKWKVAPTSLLYLSVSKGYKGGAYPTAGAASYLGFVPATQESVLAYEAGMKLASRDGSIRVNGAVFYYDYRNKQIRGRITDPIVGTLNRLINIPRSREYGAELSLQLTPVDGLNLNVSGVYLNSKIEAPFSNLDALGVFRNLEGQTYPYVSRWSGAAGARYERPISETMKIFGSADANYHSHSYAGLGELALFRLPAATVLDLQLGVEARDGRWRAALWGRNVTNTYYWNNVVTATADTVIRYAEMPATYGLLVRYRY